MSKTTGNQTHANLYGNANLFYIRAPELVETRTNGQKKIKANPYPSNRALITEQPKYHANSGNYYALLMGREFRPGRFVLLLDFDNKDEGGVSGMKLIEKLNMDQYGAPCQKTPSGGRHYLFYADAKQKESITAKTTIVHEGVKYNMDVKFQNDLCTCAPTKIEGYGSWTKGSCDKLLNIPPLPDELFKMISAKKSPATTPRATPTTTATATATPAPTANKTQIDDFRALCSCLSVSQLDNYSTWIKIGMILNSVGAPLSLWEEVSKRSKKYQTGECAKKWRSFTRKCHTIGSLFVLAKEGSPEMLDRISPDLNMNKYVFFEDAEYPAIEIDTPFLTPITEDTPKTPDQETFQRLTDETMDDPSKKTLVVRSRYGSGKTTYLQRLIKARNPQRVLFITYRQTLARDIMKNFGKLGFKNYLDSYDDPSVWNAPRLIVQIDSLMQILNKNDGFIINGKFKAYDMIILDESESLLAHIDEKTMERKEIEIFDFFNAILKQCGKILMMDGDVSDRSLSFAKNYGDLTYIKNNNIQGNRIINLMLNEDQWEEQLRADLDQFYKEDPKFRVCIVSQSSSKVNALYDRIKEQCPHLVVKKLVGADGGETKRQFFEDINVTLESANVFMYSPVIEAGVDITVKVKKVYGILSTMSNSQRAFLQMINRCRCVEEPRMDFLKGDGLHINSNYNFWRYSEVLELNRHTVDTTRAEFIIEDGELMLEESALSKQRKSISVYNTVERLNKHPSVFINYLRVLAEGKGIKFQIQSPPEEQKGQPKKKKTKKQAKVEEIMTAKDLTDDEYEELSLKKKMGKTTTEENLQCEKRYWQRELLTSDLKEEILQNFIYGQNPLRNFLSLVDLENHEAEDNLRSDKQIEKVKVVKRLLELLGWEHARDETQLKKDLVRDNFAERVVKDPLFTNRLRLNELFELEKKYKIHEDMTPQQILMWANSLLKPFSLQIRAGEKTYQLDIQNELMSLITRKNKNGRIYKDGRNLLNQKVRKQVVEEYLFLDDEPSATTGNEKPKAQMTKKPFDTSRLDVDINADDE